MGTDVSASAAGLAAAGATPASTSACTSAASARTIAASRAASPVSRSPAVPADTGESSPTSSAPSAGEDIEEHGLVVALQVHVETVAVLGARGHEGGAPVRVHRRQQRVGGVGVGL